MKNKNKDLSKEVMSLIESNEVKMRPKIFFVFGSIMLGAGLALALLFSTFFINLTVFRLRVHPPTDYLKFGKAGFKPFLTVLPKYPLFFAVLFIILGLILIKKYDFSYKKSFVGLVAGLITFILVFGLLLERVGINEKLIRISHLKPLVYGEHIGKDWVSGKIIEIDKEIYTLQTPLNKLVKIKISENVHKPSNLNLHIDQEIRAVGKWEGNIFYARGILPKPNLKTGKMNVKGFQAQKRYLFR